MKNRYLIIPVLLVITALLISACGGDSSGVIPGTPAGENQEQYITKDLSGYIYFSPETEEVSEKFIILSVPLNEGEDALQEQLEEYFDSETPEIKERYNLLTGELSKWKPLPEYGGAQLFGIYEDSKNSSPISVDSDGYFSTTLQVKSTDDVIKLEVISGEDKCFPVEALPATNIETSEEEAAKLISCPERVLTLPGGFMLFAVTSDSAVNLKDAHLSFTLNDNSIGCCAGPYYLRCRGKKDYTTAYGIFFATYGIATPSSSSITAQTDTGLSLDIFTEVIGTCSSIEGHVGGSGVIPVAGIVYSLGPGFGAIDCLDGAGNYKLDRVFRGHYRSVVAVYWVAENGGLKKYREERVISFFDEDLEGFDLPETVQVSPTIRPPGDPFYDQQVTNVIYNFELWEEQLSKEEAIQMTVDWLNNKVPTGPPVTEGITKSYTREDDFGNTDIVMEFEDGIVCTLGTGSIDTVAVPPEDSQSRLEKKQFKDLYKKSSPVDISTSEVDVIEDLLVLAPYAWQHDRVIYGKAEKSVHNDIVNIWQDNDFYKDKIKAKITRWDDLKFGKAHHDVYYNTPKYPVFPCLLKSNDSIDNIITPYDIQKMGDYEMTYLITHVNKNAIMIPYVEGHPGIEEWMRKYAKDGKPKDTNKWEFYFHKVNFFYYGVYYTGETHFDSYIKSILLKEPYFEDKTTFKDSIIFIAGCYSKNLREFFNAKVFIGTNHLSADSWTVPIGYYFLYYMMYGPEVPTAVPAQPSWTTHYPPGSEPNKPMELYEAFNALSYYEVNPDPESYWWGNMVYCADCTLEIYPTEPEKQYYFPAPVNVIVE